MKNYDQNYDTAAERLKVFRDKYDNHHIITEMIDQATVEGKHQVIFMARIVDNDGFTVATGHALEREGTSEINKTSWLENCETSAIGRALKTLGIGDSGNFAAKEEVKNATDKKKTVEKKEKVETGKKLTAKAKANTKPVTLDFITDKRTPAEMKKIYDGLKKMGLTSTLILPYYNRYDKEGEFKGLVDFMENCATPRLKEFLMKKVLKK